MADFLGSYYTNFLEDESISARLAILNAEQPVSILAMEKITPRTHGKKTNSFSRISALDKMKFDTISRGASIEDDLEIPVASMSLFEQDVLVSVQLRSIGLDSKERPVVRSQSSMEVRNRIEMAQRARTTDFDIDPPTCGTDRSAPTPVTPRTDDSFFGVVKRTATLKSSLMKFIGRKNKFGKRK